MTTAAGGGGEAARYCSHGGAVRLEARASSSSTFAAVAPSEGSKIQVFRLCFSDVLAFVPLSADLAGCACCMEQFAHFVWNQSGAGVGPEARLYLASSARKSAFSRRSSLFASCSVAFSCWCFSISCSKRANVRSTLSARLKGNSHDRAPGQSESSEEPSGPSSMPPMPMPLRKVAI